MIKSILAAALFLSTFADSAGAANVRYDAAYNVDTAPYIADRPDFNLPYTVTNTGDYTSFTTYAEFDLTSLGSLDAYNLSVSPFGLTGCCFALKNVNISIFQGDGSYDGDEVGTDALGTLRLFDTYTTGVELGWYTPDGSGGFQGDRYLDIASVVETAANAGWSYLGFELTAAGPRSAGITLRGLAITNYGTPTPPGTPSGVPEVSATGSLAAIASLLALMAFLWERRRVSAI